MLRSKQLIVIVTYILFGMSLMYAQHHFESNQSPSITTEPPPPGQSWSEEDSLELQNLEAQEIVLEQGPTNFVIEAAEQNKDICIQNVAALLDDSWRQYSDVYTGLHTFGGADILTNLVENCKELFLSWYAANQANLFIVVFRNLPRTITNE